MSKLHLLVCIVLVIASCRQNDGQVFLPGKKVVMDSNVLLVATGYSSRQTNISSEDLIARLKEDSINTFVLKSVYKQIELLLPHIAAQQVNRLEDVQMSDTVLILTDINNLAPMLKVIQVNNVDFFEEPSLYPLTLGKDCAEKIRKKLTTINLTGVTAITRGLCTAIESEGMDYIISDIKPYFAKADYVHISNEVSFTDDCPCGYPTMRFCSKKEYFNILLDLNCNIVELTGNHNRDYGEEAFIQTLKWYKENNIKVFGGGSNPDEANTPLILKLKDSSRIGFIGFNELCPLDECADRPGKCGANRFDTLKARLVLHRMKKELKCNYIIASVQFSEIDSYCPHSAQKQICRYLLEKGADMVYGSQAHQVQQIAFIHGKPVFYGLGNFLFDQVHKQGLRQAYFLQLFFYKGKLIQVRPVFTFLQNDMKRKIASVEEAEEIRKNIFVDSLLYDE